MIIIRLAALIGRALAELRAMSGMSQGALGDRAGIAESRISKYERTLVTPDIETTRKLLNASGYHLAAVPIVEAETDAERRAVAWKAYLWRYATVTPGVDVAAAEHDLIEAVDALDEAQAAARDGSPRAADAETPQEIIVRLRAELRAWEATGAALTTALRAMPAAKSATDDGFEPCDHPRLVPRLPCPMCAPRYAARAEALR